MVQTKLAHAFMFALLSKDCYADENEEIAHMILGVKSIEKYMKNNLVGIY